MTLLWGERVGASVKNSMHPDLCRGSSYSVSLETHRKLSLQVMKNRLPCSLALHIMLLRERVISVKWICHSPLTDSTLLTRLEWEMLQQNKLLLASRKNDHVAVPAFRCLSCFPQLSSLGFHTRPNQSHLPSPTKASEAGKHAFISDTSFYLSYHLCPSRHCPG